MRASLRWPMRPTDRSHAMAFLLSLGTMPLGCAADDGDDTGASTNPSTTPGSGNPSSSAGTDATDGGGTDSPGTVSAGTDDPTTQTTASTNDPTVDPTTDPTVDPSGDPDGGSTGDGTGCPADVAIPEACSTYASKYAECYPRYASYAAELERECACLVNYEGPQSGPECATAFEEAYACLSMLPCDSRGLECEDEFVMVDQVCELGSEEGGRDEADGG